ncbi:conserved hypothetical phage tail region protein [uncultured Clostridium sp.]|nr:conserved hypothetical phage tail region protein [uncultured Clostridium sp.]
MLGHGLGGWADLCNNFSFRVFIGNQEFGFSRVTNLEQEQEIEEFQVGGMNYAPHIAVSSNKKSGRLILEKGKCVKGQSQIANWRAGYRINSLIDVYIYDKNGKNAGSYGINGGLIVKWEVTGLDALGSELLIQKFEIAHDGVEMGYPAV